MRQVVDTLPELPEWTPSERPQAVDWPSFSDAMRTVHSPTAPADGDLASPARTRLAYDEYIAGQLALLLVRSAR